MARCIFYKNGVYVITTMNASTAKENDAFICADDYQYVKNDGYLYGGRVRIHFQNEVIAYSPLRTIGMNLVIDGIEIVNTTINEGKDLARDIESIMCHLNSIEANGVDAFLTNYKESIKATYEELKELRELQLRLIDKADDDEKKKDHLQTLEGILSRMTLLVWIIFSLSIRMPAALDNERITNAYEAVIEYIN